MKFFSKHIVFFILVSFLSGCSSFNCTPLEKLLGGDVDTVRLANVITNNLITNAVPPLIPRLQKQAILTTSFVNLDTFKETSSFGRLIQEQIGARLVSYNFTVKELHLTNTLKIRPEEGETMLSRDLSKINPDYPAQAILVGTYSLNNRILYITAKLINPISRNIIAAENYRLCMDDNLLALLGLKRKSNNYYHDEIEPPRRSLINAIFY